jgi:hypothetical protein
MKNLKVTALVFLVSMATWAQDYTGLSAIQMTNFEQYKSAEPKVLECCNYLFANPLNSNDANRVQATQFIVRWMEGTPDYSFEIDETVATLTEGRKDLIPLFLAAMTKVQLSQTDKVLSEEEIKEQSINIFIDYCAEPKNEVKPTKEVKRILKERSGTVS